MNDVGFIQPGESIQRKQREYSEEWVDNHGRHFGGQYDVRTMRPVEELRPIGFNPPWLPPPRFMKWKTRMGFAFSWDYETMSSELAGGTAVYYADVTKFMVEHMPASEPPRIGQPVHSRVRQVLGVPPLSPAVPLAAQAGDPWLLGVSGAVPNERLKALITQSIGVNGKEAIDEIKDQLQELIGAGAIPAVPARPDEDERVDPKAKKRSIDDVDIDSVGYRQFLAQSMKAGQSMAEAAALWHQHQATLAAATA